ncbi:MAG TPA: flagellar hook-basal body complex protein FliE [Stenomitos sp.]
MAGLPPFLSLPGAPGLGFGLPLPKITGVPDDHRAEFGRLYDSLQAPQQGVELPVPPAQSLEQPSMAVTAPGAAKAFDDLGKPLGAFLDSVNNLQLQSADLKQELATGGDVELHDVMIASEKAGVALNLTMQVRNKLVDAYQEIMRMSV